MKNKKISFITKVAIFSALSSILYVVPGLQFPLPFFPPFLKIQFSNFPAILCGFITGPLGGALVILIKVIVKILFTWSDTMLVGEVADVIIGLSVVLSSSIIYRKIHNKKGGILAISISTLVWVVVAVLINWLLLIPNYIVLLFDGNVSAFVGLCSVIPGINETNYMSFYLLFGALPFNLLLAIISNGATFIVYKKTSELFKKID